MLATYSKIKLSLAIVMMLAAGACSTGATDTVAPIGNPFQGFGRDHEAGRDLKFKTTHGDASYEVTVPSNNESDVEVPFADNGKDKKLGDDTQGGVDYQYRDAKPTMADREIASTFKKSQNSDTETKRDEIEQGLGLQPTGDAEKMDQSYLSKVDVIKQLFRGGRFEAALIELDHLVQTYPNNSRLYEMRGSVLDRLGYADLAIKSWRQALEFNPSRLGLKKLIERREAQRSVASDKGKN